MRSTGPVIPAAHSMPPASVFIAARSPSAPLSYRYATLPEHVLMALTALEGPGAAVIDAALIAARASPGQDLLASARELAAKVAASLAREAQGLPAASCALSM